MGMQVGGTEGGVKSEPNVVPMIDIMLVLLIIFMIVTPVLSTGFKAEMPLGRNIEPAEEEDGDVVLGLDNEGNYYLDPGTGTIGIVPEGRLEDALRQIYDDPARKDKIMYFRADKELPFGNVQEAIETARTAGVRVLAAVTVEAGDESGSRGRGRR